MKSLPISFLVFCSVTYAQTNLTYGPGGNVPPPYVATGAWSLTAHISVDEPSQLLACNMSTSSTSPLTNLPLNETVISPLASTPTVPFLSILYPGAGFFGGAQSQ
jgi:hypothetical protein